TGLQSRQRWQIDDLPLALHERHERVDPALQHGCFLAQITDLLLALRALLDREDAHRVSAASRSNAPRARRTSLPTATATACRWSILAGLSPPKRSIKSKVVASISTG